MRQDRIHVTNCCETFIHMELREKHDCRQRFY